MKKQEIENPAEELQQSVSDIFVELFETIDRNMFTNSEHIKECVSEMNLRLKERKAITILQKNVLLNLLNTNDNLIRRRADLKRNFDYINSITSNE